MTELAAAIDIIATWLFSNVVMWFLLGTGLFLTLRFGVVQLRRLPRGVSRDGGAAVERRHRRRRCRRSRRS